MRLDFRICLPLIKRANENKLRVRRKLGLYFDLI